MAAAPRRRNLRAAMEIDLERLPPDFQGILDRRRMHRVPLRAYSLAMASQTRRFALVISAIRRLRYLIMLMPPQQTAG
jgi:hypothetical protein